MLSILEAEGNYIATRVPGKISKADYQKILPIINEQLQTNEKIRGYFEMVESNRKIPEETHSEG